MRFTDIFKSRSVKIALVILALIIILSILAYLTKGKISGSVIKLIK